ncbi:U2 snRNP-associated SURP motif-containing protein [Naviculisporaceae sp. PSN 640]
MSSNKNLAEFPDAEAKLLKIEKSAYEKRKAEERAKQQKKEKEDAEFLQGFLKDFADDDSDDNGIFSQKSRQNNSRHGTGPPDRPHFGNQPPQFGGGAGKRHFGVTPLKSGPGSLGPPPTSFGKKRSYDGFQSGQHSSADEPRGRYGFESRESGPLSVSKAFDNASDDEETTRGAVNRAEEKAISKPTLRLQNLPPNTSTLAIKSLIQPTLTVENVKIVPPSGPSGAERKSITAIVTLSAETSSKDIESLVNSLQNKYLGFGYFLSLHKHLSSAAIASGLPTIHSSGPASQPFGAKPIEKGKKGGFGSHAMGFGHGVPPPSSYDSPSSALNGGGSRYYVPVQAPRDIRLLRVIHKVVEKVIEHGAEFEALLMSRPEVQRDEEWAWLWDARSEGGIWYRWRLWEIMSGFDSSKHKGEKVRLFLGKDNPLWQVPEPLPYEFTTYVDEFVSDSEYHSEEDEGFEDNIKDLNNEEDTFLGPIDKARLTHLLARLPTTLSKLRKVDIAPIATFAITHASRGAEEIVDMVLQNIESPFAFTSANPGYRRRLQGRYRGGSNSRAPSPGGDTKPEADTPDKSNAHLIGLYVANDIISASGQSSIRHAWRFRQIFETALKTRKTFEILGTVSEKLNLGRLRADKWKRSVGLVLDLWEGWSAFSVESQAYFVNSFKHPPSAKKEVESNGQEKNSGKWKSIGADGNKGSLPVSVKPDPEIDSPAKQEEEWESSDSSGDPLCPKMRYSAAADALNFSDEDLDGEPGEDFEESGNVHQPQRDGDDTVMKDADDSSKASGQPTQIKLVGGFRVSASNAGSSVKKRMQAMDMFADMDSDGDN